MITGVSTGALMATYVFAGEKFSEDLHKGYTTVSATDIFEVAATPESLADAWPLEKLIEKRVTPEIVAAVAAEHAKGRRLFVVTTNMDAGRPMVWNMGAIAAHGGEAALKLYRQVLLASASIEGVFQPVYITAEANGHQFQEMHADGGVNGPLFFGPVTGDAMLGQQRLDVARIIHPAGRAREGRPKQQDAGNGSRFHKLHGFHGGGGRVVASY